MFVTTDTGQVSPIAILERFYRSVYGDTIWISVLDTNKQVIIEPFIPATDEIKQVDALVKSLDLLDFVHSMDGLLFLKWQGATLFVGKVSEVSQMSLSRFREVIYDLTGDIQFLKAIKGQNKKPRDKGNLQFTQLPMF
jgi:hypothetical protein